MDQKVKNVLRSYVFDGVLMLALGIVLLIWPKTALNTIFYVIGAAVALMGLIKVIFFFAQSADRAAMDLVMGVAQIGLGVALIVKVDFFIEFFNVILAILLAYGALLLFAQAVILRRGAFFALALIFAVITMALAVIIFLDPAGFASFMTQLRGIALIVEGLAMLIVLAKVKKTA
ncbi:MAG: DUF308 domain-containing protein [Clostridia bacterium]|nr:DUF308 domain-containing protein [Clostridia bacterium]